MSYLPVVHGFNQKSHLPAAALQPASRTGGVLAVAGAHCDLAPRLGFSDSTSFASC